MSPAGGSAASWASLAFDAAGGCARFSLAVALTLPVTAVKAGSSSGRTWLGGTGGCSSASAASGAGAVATSRRSTDHRRAGSAAPLPFPPGAVFFAPARPSGLTAGTFLGGGTGFFAGTAPGPKPVVVTASADAGGRTPSRSTGTPAAFAALQALLDSVGGRFVTPQLTQCAVDVRNRLIAGKLHPTGQQGVHRRIAGCPLQRQHRPRSRRKRPVPRPGPGTGLVQRIVGLLLDSIGRHASPGHSSRLTEIPPGRLVRRGNVMGIVACAKGHRSCPTYAENA